MLSLLGGCNDDSVLGLEVQPEGSLSPVQFIDTFTIKARTITTDPQQSSQFRAFIGRLENEAFGSTEARLSLNFRLESENISLDGTPSDYTVDRVSFRIFPREVYGNGNDSLPIELYLLDEQLFLDSTYTANRIFRLDDGPVARTNLQIEDNQAIGELLIDSAFQGIVWEMDPDIGSYLLNGLGTVYTNTEQFQSYFKGIQFRVAEDAILSGGGALYDFAIASGETGIVLEYHANDNPDDKLQIIYEMADNTSRVNSFIHTPGTSALGDALSTEGFDANQLFVQGLNGTKANIEIPYLDEFGANADLAVNLATLTFSIDALDPDYIAAAPILYLLDYEIDPATGDTIETLNLDYIFSSNRHGGALNEEENTYTFDITRQVQKILEAAEEGDDINFGFTLNAQVPVLNQNSMHQTVLSGSDNIVFKVYYTDISQ